MQGRVNNSSALVRTELLSLRMPPEEAGHEGLAPELDLLAEALETAWERIQEDKTFAIGNRDACRSAFARYIIESARRGERDKEKLVEDALFHFRL